MRELLERRLLTGNAHDARDFQAICDSGVGAVVDLAAEETPADPPRDLIYCRFPLVDGSANDDRLLRISCQTVASLITARVKTLVCCGAGMSRALTVAIVGLAIAEDQSPEALLKELIRDGAHDVAPALWSQAVEACASRLTCGQR